MSENLVELWTTQFSTNLELKLQQVGSKLRGRTREGSHVGKQASPINQIGPIQSRAPSGFGAPMGRVDAQFTRRWVFPTDRELPQLIDEYDKLRTIVDPTSGEMEAAAAAFGRDWDDALILSANGTAMLGTDANSMTTETWASFSGLYTVAVGFKGSSTTGLTVAKLIEAKRIFRKNHVDLEMERPTLVIGSQQESELLSQVEVVSTEFNDHPVLVEGSIVRFMGFDIVVSERLTVTSSIRQCLAFVKSGLYLGIWRDNFSKISQRDDLSGLPWQLFSSHTFGSTRTEPGRVVEVDAYDTTGADITP